MTIKVSAETQLGFLERDVLPLLKAVKAGFTPDPGTSDLDDEQPIHVTIPLGEYRRAERLHYELAEAKRQPSEPPPDSAITVLLNALYDPRWQFESSQVARDIADRARKELQEYLAKPVPPERAATGQAGGK